MATSCLGGFAFPAVVLLVHDDFLAWDSQQEPVPQRNANLFAVKLLDHRDPVTEHCHAVTPFQGALLLAADVILLARSDLTLGLYAHAINKDKLFAQNQVMEAMRKPGLVN